jgi:hypothetical protein
MTVRRTSRIRTATVLAGITAATLTGVGIASATPTATADGAVALAAPGDSLPDVSADGSGWPAELTEHTRLYVNPYRSYLVTIRDGKATLVLSTGFDSCYVMTQDGEQRYPC